MPLAKIMTFFFFPSLLFLSLCICYSNVYYPSDEFMFSFTACGTVPEAPCNVTSSEDLCAGIQLKENNNNNNNNSSPMTTRTNMVFENCNGEKHFLCEVTVDA